MKESQDYESVYINIRRKRKMVVKKVSITGLKEVKKDLLKVISKIDLIEQNMLNLSIKIKRIENRVGMPR